MDHFGRLLKQANNNMMRHFDQFAKQFGLTGNQMAVIDFIMNHEKQEIFQRDIEHEFNIQRSTTTVLLQRMEKKGLIERHTSSKDARQKAVVLTDKAVKIASACQVYLRAEEEEFAQQFSAEEREIFLNILQHYRNL
ncbi:MarR family winged helix-turn-helix transcriptional regulator [Streptococcus sp.]|uniref:MarR family winged helix-turn-helix transcriptional regulator n=1 Tax=Streptococcus sp. TaxID=1306 RepID=UPI0025D5B8ED|nr:MarR family winged helix-turn-helix transcriptional regulator [Streptococcus sp.]